jgi:hypothetical protein
VGRMAPRILQGVREVCGLLDTARAKTSPPRAGPQAPRLQ